MRRLVDTPTLETAGHPDQLAQRKFGRTVLLLIGLGFAAVIAAALAAALVNTRTQAQAGWVVHTYEVERQVGGIRLALERLRSARRGAIIGLTGARAAYAHAKSDLESSVATVRRLTADNPVQQNNIAQLGDAVKTLEGMLDASMAKGEGRNVALEPVRQEAATRVQSLAEAMLAEESRLLGVRDNTVKSSVSSFYVALAIMVLMLAIVGLGSFWVIRRYTFELAASRDELRGLNENLEDAVRERTTDLQRANDEIQRFAYIVSHDLRSPLVNVMGFTAELDASTRPLSALIERADAEAPELVTEDARRAVAEDLPEAIGFIRSSTQKMDRLINAILRLSREGRRPLTPEKIDLADLVGSTVDSLRHRIDQLGVEVRIGSLPTIISDRVALEQILSNLIENAVKYLRADRPGTIDIAGTRQGERVTITVRDNGRGIEKRDHERIFDLFRRSGAQDQPGEGIGLAHVRALAYRLGGTIDVASELGDGSTFKVNLPADFAGEKGGDR
jgi:signal transduction histidine kinase